MVDKKLRILFVTNNFTPYSGGVVSSIKATIQMLEEKGHEIFVVTLNFLKSHIDDPEYVYRVSCPLKFMYQGNFIAIPWRPTAQLRAYIIQVKPDIIHIHHPFLLGVCALKIAKELGIPTVFTHHTMYEEYVHYIQLPQGVMKALTRLRVKDFCNSVSGVIVPTCSVKEYLQSLGVTNTITILPSALQQKFVFPIKPVKYKDPYRFNLLVVSRLVVEKNLFFILDLFKQLPSFCYLTIAGYGVLYEDLKKYAETVLQLDTTRFVFIYKPSQKELSDLYTKADIFLFSSKTDTQGLVIAESFAHATPVVALDGPGQRSSIINGLNGYIVYNKQEMINVIIALAQDSNHCKELQEGAWKSSQNYVPEVIVHQLILYYRKILNV